MRQSETVSNNKRALEFTDDGAPTALDNPLSEPTRAGHVANSPFPADVYKALLSGEGDEEEEGEGNWEGNGEWVGGGEREGEGEEEVGKNVLCVKDRNTSISRLPALSFRGVPRRPLYKHVATALFHYCHAGGLPSAVLTCQGMEEKEGRREEEVGRWHGTVMDAGGRLLELIEKLCNEYSNVSVAGPHSSLPLSGPHRIASLFPLPPIFLLLLLLLLTLPPSLPPPPNTLSPSIIAGDCITFNNTLTLAVQSVQAYPTFPHMLASEGLSAVLPGVEALEEGAKKTEDFQQPCGSGDMDGSHADVARCQAAVKSQLESQLASLIHRILIAMGPRGVSRLVGMRVTEGSVLPALPPSRSALIASFQQPVKGGVKGKKERKQRQREQKRQSEKRHDEKEKQVGQSGQGKGEQEQQDQQQQQEQEEQQDKQEQQQQQQQEEQKGHQEQEQQELQEQLSRLIGCAAESAQQEEEKEEEEKEKEEEEKKEEKEEEKEEKEEKEEEKEEKEEKEEEKEKQEDEDTYYMKTG
ncbi:unnamed protein product [Closterium sp. NIES-53]